MQIVGEDASLLANGTQNNLVCKNAPDGDFQITVHLSADPTEDFQQATHYLFQDGDNYIAINRGYCSSCDAGGSGIYLEYKFVGSWGAEETKKANDTDVFLRLVNEEKAITGYYAFEAGEWQRIEESGNYLENFKVCLGVSNVDSAEINADLIGKFNYIEISRP